LLVLEPLENQVQRSGRKLHFLGNGLGQLVAIFVCISKLGQHAQFQRAFLKLCVHVLSSLPILLRCIYHSTYYSLLQYILFTNIFCITTASCSKKAQKEGSRLSAAPYENDFLLSSLIRPVSNKLFASGRTQSMVRQKLYF